MRNIGSAPQNQRATTTPEMADSTMEPSTAALQLPMTSSMTKRMAEIGALKAAASPAAAPMGAKTRRRSRDSPKRRLMSDATPAPICSEGSSGPSEKPLPMASAESRNLPTTVRTGDVSVADVESSLGLVDAAAACLRKDVAHQQSDDQSRDGGYDDQAQLVRLWRGTAQQHAQPVDGHAERDNQQAGDDADEDREQQQQTLFSPCGHARRQFGGG